MYQTSGEHVDELPPVLNPFNAGGGYHWIDQLTGGWAAVPVWGRDGWDLGSWPLVIIAVCRTQAGTGPLWGVCLYVEGDLSISAHPTQAEMIQAVDEHAEFYWRHVENGPNDLPPDSGLLDHHRGPYNG